MKFARSAFFIWLVTGCLWTTSTISTIRAEDSAKSQSVALNWIHGPQRIDLQSGAVLSLPSGYAFLGQTDTQALLRNLGNATRGDEIGFIAPPSPGWVVIIRFLSDRHVQATEDLNRANLLKVLQDENQRNNAQWQQSGLPLVSIRGWRIPPSYDRNTHRIEWAVEAESHEKEIVNHCISILGRSGVVQLFLVDERRKPSTPEIFRELASNIQFTSGERFEDIVPNDSVARVGVESLFVSGIGAKLPENLRARLFKARLLFWTKMAIVGVFMGSFGFVLATIHARCPMQYWFRSWRTPVRAKTIRARHPIQFRFRSPIQFRFRSWRKPVTHAHTVAEGVSHINYHDFYCDLTRDLHHW